MAYNLAIYQKPFNSSKNVYYQANYFDLTPIPFPAPSEENLKLQKKLDKCTAHIARLEKSLTYRRTNKHIVRDLIDEFRKTKVELKSKIKELQVQGKWEDNPVEKMKSLPKGHLFRAQMPIGLTRNPEKCIPELKAEGITRLFLLCSEKECETTSGTNLIKLYSEHGIKVVHFPIKDFGAWEQQEFNQKVHQLHCHLLQGENVAVHCKAGIGRTGTVIAAVVSKILKIDGEKAIQYTRKHSHPGSVETMDQRELVLAFAKKYFRPQSR